ncbi:MAG: tRNA pseudouridine(55) synthase TruB [Solirubrobacterales bacterium]
MAKPVGISSHDVVERIRRAPVARGARVGHTGTLDPFASGLLLIVIGRATRFQRYLVGLPKSYRAVARFGVRSDTGDPTGTLTATGSTTNEHDVREALAPLTGEISQRVPMASAVKVGGERLYRKARRGETVETPVRTITIERLDLVEFDETDQRATLEIDCSSGTYVRRLVQDLGEACATGAHCETLVRTAVGPFSLEDADERNLIDLAHALSFLPERALSSEEAERVRHGVALPANGEIDADGGPVRLTGNGRLIAVAERDDRTLKPVTVIPEGE